MNLDLHLTTDCNMKCSFCGAWEYGKTQSYISFDEAAEALREGKKAGYKITTLTGGEPSVHENYSDIIKYAASLGYWTVVTTNGLLLTEEMIGTLKECRTLVRVSIHTLKPELHREITGTDTLSQVMENIRRLQEAGVRLGFGCTVFDRNIGEVKELAACAYEMGASFIRYTPVVGIRGAEDINLEYDFFKELLKRICDMCVDNGSLMEQENYGSGYASAVVKYMLTRRCAGGSGQHIIYDCHGTAVPCSFIPESAGLCAGTEAGGVSERFQRVYENMDELFGKGEPSRLKGRCGRCDSRDSCRGGCLTTKIPAGLSVSDEQPVCMYGLIKEICDGYGEEDRRLLENYWCSSFMKRAAVKDRDKTCMRRLPVWELNFRYGRREAEFV